MAAVTPPLPMKAAPAAKKSPAGILLSVAVLACGALALFVLFSGEKEMPEPLLPPRIANVSRGEVTMKTGGALPAFARAHYSDPKVETTVDLEVFRSSTPTLEPDQFSVRVSVAGHDGLADDPAHPKQRTHKLMWKSGDWVFQLETHPGSDDYSSELALEQTLAAQVAGWADPKITQSVARP